MPTRYLLAQPFGQPRDAGVDKLRRQVFTFTVLFTKDESDTFAEESIALLSQGGIGTPNVDLFMGSSTTLPEGVGPYVHLIEGGGTLNERIHNTSGAGYERPSLIVRVHAEDYLVCRDKARQAYRTLVPVNNQTVTFS